MDDKASRAALSAEYDNVKSSVINALLKGERVEYMELKGGLKVTRVRRKEIKSPDCMECKAWNNCISAARDGRLVKCMHFGYMQERFREK